MMLIFISFLLLLTVDGILSTANNNVDITCPRVEVICARKECYSSPFYFKAQISDGAPNQKVSYQWSITSGRIVNGQGTSSIKAVANDSHSITATVEVQGLPAECGQAIASLSVITEPAPPVEEIDEFGSLPLETIKSRLDKLAYQLRSRPGARGYILSSGKWSLSGRAQKYLLTEHGLESGRVVYVQRKTKRPLMIRLYIVPAGANPPGM